MPTEVTAYGTTVSDLGPRKGGEGGGQQGDIIETLDILLKMKVAQR